MAQISASSSRMFDAMHASACGQTARATSKSGEVFFREAPVALCIRESGETSARDESARRVEPPAYRCDPAADSRDAEGFAFVDTMQEQGRTTRTRPPLWLRWTLACGAGEMIGLVYPALAGIALAFAFGGTEPTGLGGKLLVLAVMTLAGGAEGATLGLFQARILTGFLPRLRARVWVATTAAIAMLGWIAGMSFALFGSFDLFGSGAASAAPMPEPPLAIVLLYAAGFGLTAGIVFGLGQWLVLRRHATGGVAWILAWGIAWSAAMALIFAVAGLQTETTAPWRIILGAAIAGGLAGLLIGAISSFGVTRLKPRAS